MESFTFSGNAYFDSQAQPVLLATNGVVQYQNKAMEELERSCGLGAAMGQPLPEVLADLGADAVAQLNLGGVSYQVRTQTTEAGVLYTFQELREDGLGKYEAIRLCGQMRSSLGEALVALQQLFDGMVETEQLKLEERFNPVLRQYSRILRMVSSTELLVQSEEDLKSSWNPAPLNLSSLADRLRRELGPLTRQFDCEAEGNLVVWADEKLLRQALLNLVLNGLQAGGRVEMKLRRAGEQALIVVTSAGGQPMEPQTFSRLGGGEQAVDSFRPGGLHFGMELCWKIFRLHNGTLAVTNGEAGVQVTGRIPLLRTGEQPAARSTPGCLEYDGGIPDVLVELSDYLPEEWYSVSEFLD
ncbi:MAG: HAMP domain-containing histidine kinase [Clostridiales bacterium]|nr:HAMP domain-containing histidine kinase [Clostridiales bacterium]